MVTVHGYAPTTEAPRYLNQLCRHARRIGHSPARARHPHHDPGAPAPDLDATWDDRRGVITFAGGSCTVTADDDGLHLHVEADDTARARWIRQRLDTTVTRISGHDALTVTWHAGAPPDPAGGPPAGVRR